MHKKVQVVSEGICDACVLRFFEVHKGKGNICESWLASQMRKIEGGVKWLNQTLRENLENVASDDGQEGMFMVGQQFCLADIAAGSGLGYLSVRFKDFDWKAGCPVLEKYWLALEEKPSFKETVPL